MSTHDFALATLSKLDNTNGERRSEALDTLSRLDRKHGTWPSWATRRP